MSILIDRNGIASDDCHTPPAIHARFAQFLIGKALPPTVTNHLDGLRASRRNPVRRPGHDCGWLTGKPEVGFPEAIANSVDRTIGLINAVMFTDLDDLSVRP